MSESNAGLPPPDAQIFWGPQLWATPRAACIPAPWPKWRLAAGLFALTWLSTTVVGARLAFNFGRHLPAYANNTDLFPFLWAWRHPGLLWAGLPFSTALMAILLAHELGHFFACRYYRLDSTLPMFLPTPTLIGTMGAFIRIKESFHNRREVFDVGIAGPLAGMVLTVPLLIYGLASSRVLTSAAVGRSWIEFGWPPLVSWIAAWWHPGVPATRVALSPLARAGWLGLLVTMLNLIPGAQLDGGHIAYAVAPRLHRITSWAALVILAAMGWLYWPGWYVFAALIGVMRVRHPFVPEMEPLGGSRTLLAVLALVIFIAAFTPLPIFQ
ncbi:MAG TPA: site-2 protease family protein [Terriglobales bacterium]|jgi:membrane-associated protease RseP (regulator of RpoE activity)